MTPSAVTPWWSTACPDWERRIVERRSLIPCDPLFPDEAAASLDVFLNLRIVGLPGKPTIGEACREWITELAAVFFGAYDPNTGVRHISDFHLDIAKKNIKSTLAAALLVTVLVRNWRQSGEFYTVSPTKELADNIFTPARDMVYADETLDALLHVKENQRIIEHRNTRATAKVVAADSESVGGKKTIGLIIDELWLFGKRANAEPMLREARGGLASHAEGFVLSLSTKPDGPPAGVYAQRLEYFRGVRDGKIHDPHSLGVLYEFPRRMIKDGSYKDPKNFYIPNPNLGASVNEAYILSEHNKAQRAGAASLANFYAKHLNVEPTIALRSDGWAGALVWSRGIDRSLTLEPLLERSEVVTIGIDGGGLDDLLGVAVCGRERETGRWLIWAHGLVSTIGVIRRKANAPDYLRFVEAGELTVFRFRRPDRPEAAGAADMPEDSDAVDGAIDADLDAETEGAVAELLARADACATFSALPEAAKELKVSFRLPPDVRFIIALVALVRDRGLLAKVGVDAAGIGSIVDALATIGVTQDADLLDAVRQGIGLMGAVKTAERMLADYRFLHGAQQLLAWCMGNLRIVPTPTAMRVARDESGFGKVDPAIAVFNAVALMVMNPEASDAMADIEMVFV